MGFGLSRRDVFHRGELDEVSICKSEIKLSLFFFSPPLQGVIRSFLIGGGREAQPHSSGTVCVPSIFHSDEDGTEEAVGSGGVWCQEGRGGRFEDVPSPKLR